MSTNIESTVLDPLAESPSTQLSGTAGGAIGGRVQPTTPRQLVFECKLDGCDVVIELKTHGEVENGAHRWTHLSAQTLMPRKTWRGLRGHSPAYQLPPICISWSMGELSRCHMTRWGHEDSLWIGSSSFKTRKEEFSRLRKFLIPLGVEIEDRTNGNGS